MPGLAGDAESGEHQRLVKALIDKFTFDGLEILNAAYQGYDLSLRETRVSQISSGKGKSESESTIESAPQSR